VHSPERSEAALLAQPTIPPRSGGTKGGLMALTGQRGDPAERQKNDFQVISTLLCG
jgi:hypothetical protein